MLVAAFSAPARAATDFTRPDIRITSPASNGQFTSTTAQITVTGVASDNVAVTRVTWRNSRGGSGTANGTDQWSIPAVALAQGRNYIYVRAYDATGRQRHARLVVTFRGEPVSAPGGTDTEAPSAPTGLAARAISSRQINLNWVAASDNVAVTGYRIDRCQGTACSNFTQIASIGSLTYNDSGLAGATTYRYRVRATDAAGQSGTYTPAVAATTSNNAPTISGSPPTTVQVNSTYNFTPTSSDPDGQELIFSVMGAPSWTQFNTRTGQLSGTPGAGDEGSTEGIVISVADGIDDASLPAFTLEVQPGNGTGNSGTALLSWLPPTQRTDGSPLTDLAGYVLRYGNSPSALTQTIRVSNPGLSSYQIDGLSTGTWYFNVAAYDRAGAESAPSNTGSKKVL